MKYELFNRETQAIIYGFQPAPIQRMLDFDYICKREKPSIAAIVNPARAGMHKVFFGMREILIPMYRTLEEAASHCKTADVVINFSSFRSSYATTKEAIEAPSINTIVIIAEGIPERRTRELIALAKQEDKMLIGPATAGGVVAGAFKIGNSGGTIENIVASKLHRPGCVGLVTKSGGMSNELFNIISRNTNGLYEGLAIGGDMYPGSTYIDHVERFEANPKIKMIVVLGEVGGRDEYEIVEAIKAKKVKKPIVFWSIGTCAKVFPSEVQFGHAGAKANAEEETADAKNKALKEAGASVPKSFDDFGDKIKQTYQELKKKGIVKDVEEPEIPAIPVDIKKAKNIRKPTTIVSSITDDRGDEPTYAGVPMSELFEKGYTLGDVISLLWFKRKLPTYASKFIEMALMITADHGPAVSGAHNAIVAARAGKDVVSSLASGLLTIGPRFGGALNDASKYFKEAKENKVDPEAFVKDMKAKGIYIPGIGHRIKSLKNPDKRVEILKAYANKNFPSTEYLDYALAVEQVTTQKKETLILNVDGCLAVLFLDLMQSCGKFTKEEIDEVVEHGVLNSLFILGRSIGLIGHILDQYRLKQPLYREPFDEILYLDE